jgi:transglutaminase/protease-like cytokinesis protein 3
MIRLEDSYYWVDVIFMATTYSRERYFCLTDEQLSVTHSFDNNHREIPVCNTTKYAFTGDL